MIIWNSLKLQFPHIHGYLFIFKNTEIYLIKYKTHWKIVKTTFDKFFRCIRFTVSKYKSEDQEIYIIYIIFKYLGHKMSSSNYEICPATLVFNHFVADVVVKVWHKWFIILTWNLNPMRLGWTLLLLLLELDN